MPEPIQITFLGTGSGIPSLKRGHPAILFRRAGENWLFDCGESAQLGLERAGVSPVKISKIFISHWHADHFAGLLPMIETMHLLGKRDALEIYGPEAGRFIDDIMDLSYWGVGFKLKAIEADGMLVDNDEFSVSSVKVEHGVPAVGYVYQEKDHWKIDVSKAKKLGIQPGPMLGMLKLVGKARSKKGTVRFEDIATPFAGRKIAYSGDTIVCKRFFEAARGADLLIHDSTFIEPTPTKFHSSVREVARMAKKYSVKKLVLTHFSRRYQDTSEILAVAKPIFKNVSAAYDGYGVEL